MIETRQGQEVCIQSRFYRKKVANIHQEGDLLIGQVIHQGKIYQCYNTLRALGAWCVKGTEYARVERGDHNVG